MPTDKVDVYLKTVDRLEPEITMVDRDATLTSIAISLKRIADVLERREQRELDVSHDPRT